MFSRTKTLFGTLDHPRDQQIVDLPVQVRGWVLANKPGPIDLQISLDDVDIKAQTDRYPRPDVARIYGRYAENNPNPGFSLTIMSLPPGKHSLKCTARQGRKKRVIAEIEIQVPAEGIPSPSKKEMAPELAESDKKAASRETAFLTRDQPPILLMHIPKTAGTSLNAYIESQVSQEKSHLHIENLILGQKNPDLDRLENKRFLSAHLKIDTLRRYLDTDRYFTVTMLRDPTRQTLSHLAWVKRLADPQNQRELDNSPEYIKTIVDRISSMDLVAFFDTLTREEKNFFDNCQTRYLLPFHGEVDLTPAHIQEALQKLLRFDAVLLTERYQASTALLAFYMGWQPPAQPRVLNISKKKYFIDLETANEEIKQRFERITRYDQMLYEAAEEIFSGQLRKMLMTLKREFPAAFSRLDLDNFSLNDPELKEILDRRAHHLSATKP